MRQISFPQAFIRNKLYGIIYTKKPFDIRTFKGTEELIQSDEVQSAVDDVVSAFDEIKNAFKGFINVNCDDLGKIRETAYQGPK